jgi:hypothetical protein
MNIEDLSSFALQRVAAHEGLAIDAATWQAAHGYHQIAQRLHTRALHGWGIVSGLQVTPATPPGRLAVLQPGVAVDRDGNVIRVPQPVRLAIPPGASGTVCCVLRFVEVPVEAGASQQPSRINEFFNLLAAPPPLRPNDIEVARFELSDTASPVRAATDPWAPGPQEIDDRFRRQLHLPIGDTLAIGQLALTDQSTAGLHRRGLIQVVRELRASAPFAVQFVGDVRAEAAVGTCHLLYLAGAGSVRMTPKEGAQLLAFLRGGGILFAEPCVEVESQQQENGRFVATFSKLMADLKQELAPLGPDHPLFSARYVFGAAPDGAGGHAPLLGKGNVILNPNDYGCCWQGGGTGKPLPRETIRGAMEFAANAGWLAVDEVSRHAQAAVPQQTAERVG